ncbi:MAG: flavodoxin [Synergistaceae bacterium]|nr:flavodoxin [Synergistaceae bacterium]MBQ6737901.1 flavodoxin [Synergistaceae bacterium]MBQ7068769.1 flavodoxin [Synergistaceae bacterium]MBR0253502.1 flavodoxin [Synergistaceae bacterium]MBR0317284.1 flavodoxin [Synergistaceae bacterium]
MRNLVLSLMVLLFSCSACAANAKSLVIIFSRADENYTVGYIEKGNTMILAEMIAEKTNSELFEVKPAKKYPADYDTCIDVAKREQNQNARPAILEDKDISEYDTIFFGYPVWWGDIPMCMYTFVEGHDWNGKKVIPFCTHEGSGSGRTDGTLKKLMAGANIERAFAMAGHTAQNNRTSAEKEIDTWLKKLGY